MTTGQQVHTTQYDLIGKTYNCVEQLPAGRLLELFVVSQIGNVQGLRALDLACGTGYYSRKLVEWGAKAVTGVDISYAMIENARAQAREMDDVKFIVADCTKPLDQGQFDLVFASWLLNYASNEAELGMMWRNVFNNLKPGGRFVGILPNFHLLGAKIYPLLAAGEYQYGGVGVQLLDRDENDWVRVQATFHTETPVSFSCYMLPKSLHEDCAKRAGMQDIRWIEAPDSTAPRVDVADCSLPPVFQMVTAVRPGLT